MVKESSCNSLVSQLRASFANLIRKLNKVVLIFLCLQMFLNIGQHLPMSMTQPQIKKLVFFCQRQLDLSEAYNTISWHTKFAFVRNGRYLKH